MSCYANFDQKTIVTVLGDFVQHLLRNSSDDESPQRWLSDCKCQNEQCRMFNQLLFLLDETSQHYRKGLDQLRTSLEKNEQTFPSSTSEFSVETENNEHTEQTSQVTVNKFHQIDLGEALTEMSTEWDQGAHQGTHQGTHQGERPLPLSPPLFNSLPLSPRSVTPSQFQPPSATPFQPFSATPSQPLSATPSPPLSAIPFQLLSATPSPPLSAIPFQPLSATPFQPFSATPSLFRPLSGTLSQPLSGTLLNRGKGYHPFSGTSLNNSLSVSLLTRRNTPFHSSSVAPSSLFTYSFSPFYGGAYNFLGNGGCS